MAKLKIGVFGAGRGQSMIGQLLHSEDAELVTICDKYEPLLETCKKEAEECGVKVALYSDFEDFFNHDMDAVVLANYAHEHAKYAVRLLDSGRSIMSEVLACANLAEAVELVEAVERSGKVYSYAENYCYLNSTYEMKDRYQRGDIGEIMYGEGEYIHDCSSIWPQITYGEREHWRNNEASTYYCTHSLGPLVYISGLRPVRVSGFETMPADYMCKLGLPAGASGIEMVTLENGAILKSIHGNLRREPCSLNYEVYGTTGMMETNRWDLSKLHIYQQTGGNCVGEHTEYEPAFKLKGDVNAGHGGSDFYTVHYFIQQLLGDEESARRCIDVYQALDMTIPGILAYRSILNGNAPLEVPNLRLKTERDKYRNDRFCTFKESAGDMYVSNSAKNMYISDDVYKEVERKWKANEPG